MFNMASADVDEVEVATPEVGATGRSPLVMEISESPTKTDKRKGVMRPESSRVAEDAWEAPIAEVARRFVQDSLRCVGSSSPSADSFSLNVSLSLKGLNFWFWPVNMEATRIERWDVAFTKIRADLGLAFNLIPNVMKTESVLHDDSDVSNQLLESLAHSMDTTEEFAQKLAHNLAWVS